MLQKTRGLVLSHIRYQETSIIVKIYTEELGLQSYIVNSVRSKSSKTNKIALFQPLTLLDLVVYYNEKKSINRIAEQKCNYPFSSIPFNIVKSTLAMFISELLNKVLSREEEANPTLFFFVFEEIKKLDQSRESLANFHLLFLLKFLSHLGIQPLSANSMYESIFTSYQGNSTAIILSEKENEFINHVLRNDEPITISHSERKNILQFTLNFYYSQFENFGVIKSKDILAEVLG